MVNPGENVSLTLKREFTEEAMNSLEASDNDKKEIESNIKDLFNKGEIVSELYPFRRGSIFRKRAYSYLFMDH